MAGRKEAKISISMLEIVIVSRGLEVLANALKENLTPEVANTCLGVLDKMRTAANEINGTPVGPVEITNYRDLSKTKN